MSNNMTPHDKQLFGELLEAAKFFQMAARQATNWPVTESKSKLVNKFDLTIARADMTIARAQMTSNEMGLTRE